MRHWLEATALLWLLLAAPAAAAPTVAEFDIPTAASEAQDIVLGPDGKLWFTEKTANKVGRVTPGTPPVIDEFDLPTGFTEPFNITVGPDNRIWFSCKDLAEITGLTAGARPEYIAQGPDNTLWFTEKDGNRIGRITGIELPQPPPPPPPPSVDVTRPDVTGFRITRRIFRVGGLGTVIRWTQSEDAGATIRFARLVDGRWRTVRRKMSFQSTAGSHRLRFRGRFDLRHPLRPGRWRMTFRVRDAAGNVSAPDRARFRLLRAITPPR